MGISGYLFRAYRIRILKVLEYLDMESKPPEDLNPEFCIKGWESLDI